MFKNKLSTDCKKKKYSVLDWLQLMLTRHVNVLKTQIRTKSINTNLKRLLVLVICGNKKD